MWRKGDTCILLAEMKVCAAIMENSMGFLKKLKIEQMYHPTSPLLVFIQRRLKINHSRKIYCLHLFFLSPFYAIKPEEV